MSICGIGCVIYRKRQGLEGLYTGYTDGLVIVFDCGIQLTKPHYNLAVSQNVQFLFAWIMNYDNANRIWLKPKDSSLSFHWQTHSTKIFLNMREKG